MSACMQHSFRYAVLYGHISMDLSCRVGPIGWLLTTCCPGAFMTQLITLVSIPVFLSSAIQQVVVHVGSYPIFLVWCVCVACFRLAASCSLALGALVPRYRCWHADCLCAAQPV